MIAYLTGKIQSIENETAILNVNGVGYELHCSTPTLNDISDKNQVSVFVYTNVREDAIQLYGFSTKNEKELFLSLNKVNGIGPKMAQKILSGTSAENLIAMIESEDTSGLSKLPKVGKKTAEQIVLSLKGKLVTDKVSSVAGPKREIVSALVNLGFKLGDVERAVVKMPAETDLENGVRLGLQALTNI